ncbi:DUF1284 domain-containing protein [Comamonas flocculans]|uniref:DUF1284 domain-containing protein n=1 Tax=Comamonas flocculans TaxID=2597701 RepID=A0A5B8RVY8_9BURK|nr:DUF1284 domain-containing protein [Comamonas flocculans]QEA13716.1 DUF1284 domain-containing protein [Comamonas flocculans]
MTLALRAHHLLCLLTYSGEGYSPAFVANFDAIVARLADGEALTLASGPDAICEPLCAGEGEGAHCHGASVRERDRQAAQALAPLLGAPGSGGGWRLDASLLARLRAAFSAGRIRAACSGCPWDAMCTEVARQGYATARLHPPPS